MVNVKHLRGKIGVHLVIIELFKRGIDALPTPTFWGFDLFTMNGVKLEVKVANKSKSKGGAGYICERFTFRLSEAELVLLDFLILVLNTQKDYLFYIIPKDSIDSKTIAFNPFSTQKSKYEVFLNRWDLLEVLHEKISNSCGNLYCHNLTKYIKNNRKELEGSQI